MKLKLIPNQLGSFITEYFSTSNIHGFNFIAKKNSHWTERLFWICVCFASWMGTIKLILISWKAFQEQPTSFVAETSYLEFKENFPAVSTCETNNQQRITNIVNKTLGFQSFQYEELVQELSYFLNFKLRVTQICNAINCSDIVENIPELVKEVYGTCDEVFLKCHWKGVLFNCCDHFKPYLSETGQCYLFKFDDNTSKALNKLAKVRALPSLSLELKGDIKTMLHSQQERVTLTSITIPETGALEYGQEVSVLFKLMETGDDNGVKYLTKSQRRCRYEQDKEGLELANYYSQSTCSMDCRYRKQMEYCNCSVFTMTNSDPKKWCRTVNQILCALEILERWVSENKSKDLAAGCHCDPDCFPLEINHVKIRFKETEYYSYPKVHFKLLSQPSGGYRRIVVKGKLDLVVSIGGAASLFVGASLLSFCELVYFFSVRLVVKLNAEIPDEERGHKKEKNDGLSSETDDNHHIIPFTN